jgi:hypothetical protein
MTKPNILRVLQSVLAAFMGVQSQANREKDFSEGSLPVYIVAGVLFTLAFIASVIWVVNRVLA